MGAAEQLIQTSLLGEAIDAGPALVFVADDLMRYVAVNEAACKTLGYTRDELLAMRVTDVVADGEAPGQYYEMVAQGFRHGLATLTCRDGRTVRFAYRAERTTVGGLELFVSVGFAEG